MGEVISLQTAAKLRDARSAAANKAGFSGAHAERAQHGAVMMEAESCAFEHDSDAVPMRLPAREEDWEDELDLMGTGASITRLQAHLAAAPNPLSPAAQFLRGYLAYHACHTQ